jgi:putative mRNA 3-end processing factor
LIQCCEATDFCDRPCLEHRFSLANKPAYSSGGPIRLHCKIVTPAPGLVDVIDYRTPEGLYCEKGNFFVDPWRSVDTALITHAHADHARSGSAHYIATAESSGILHKRLGQTIDLQGVAYDEPIKLGDTWVSFHPAGHVLGSAQIRVEYGDEVWVVSGDYKRCADPSCQPFEVIPCDTFITEATFGLPIYRWESGAETARQNLPLVAG